MYVVNFVLKVFEHFTIIEMINVNELIHIRIVKKVEMTDGDASFDIHKYLIA